MAIVEEWFLDKIVLPSSVEIQAMDNCRLDAGIVSMMERGAGEVHPNFIASQSQRPSINLTTPSLDTIFGNVPVIGAAIANATFYRKKGSTTGRVARATTSHEKEACTTAHLCWQSARLPHNGKGTVDVQILPIYDGSNEPFIHTGSVALSGSVTTQDYFGAGPVYINGTEYSDVQEITIATGIELEELGGSSELYLTAVATRTVQVTIEVRMLRSINFGSALGLNGVALDGTSGFIAYGRKYSPDGNRIANATAGHVGISALFGRVIPLDVQGDGTTVISDRFRVECRYDATPGTSARLSGATKIDGDPLFQNL